MSVALLVLGAAAWAAWSEEFEYDRAALLRGEIWRLWTAHLVHYGASHLGWNLAVFLAAGAWLERRAPAAFRTLLALAPVAISGGLLLTDPALARYAGLSGVATATLTLLALTKLDEARADTLLWRMMLALVVVKIAVESVGERALFAEFDRPGVQAMPVAHLIGAATAAALHWARRRPVTRT